MQGFLKWIFLASCPSHNQFGILSISWNIKNKRRKLFVIIYEGKLYKNWHEKDWAKLL